MFGFGSWEGATVNFPVNAVPVANRSQRESIENVT
jgi:hypothetical protein